MKSTRTAEAAWHEKYERWQVNVQKDGVRRSFYSSIPSKRGKAEAERKADLWLTSGSSKDVRFDVAWSGYLEHVKATTKTESYVKAESIGRIWFSKLDKRKLSSIAPGDFQEIVEKAGRAGRTHGTCGNIRAQAVALYQYCKSKRYPLEDPRPLVIPTSAPKGERTILQPADIKTLFSDEATERYGKRVPDPLIHAYRFLFLVALREGELCGIRNEDIKDGVLYLTRAFNRFGEETQGKNKNARRVIVLPGTALSVIDAQRAMLKARGIISPWLFPGKDGTRLNNKRMYKSWVQYGKAHGISTTVHELRHSAISVLKADLPLALMKKPIGHSASMDTLGTYGHEVDGDAQRAAEIMEQVYQRMIR